MDRRNLPTLVLLCTVFVGVTLLSGGVAHAQGIDTQKTEEESGTIVKLIIKILVKWVAPLLAIISAFYGLTRGFKRGEWDYAALCIVAAIALALLPKIILGIFGINPGDVGYAN